MNPVIRPVLEKARGRVARRALAAVGAAVALLLGVTALTLPPAAPVIPVVPDTARSGVHVLRGAYHVHTSRSDGSGTPDEIAAAARDAGIEFVVLTDHGDGTRRPDPPRYQSGVLLIDAVEISTREGHVVALGMLPAPYPLGGHAQAVVEDVHRLGGLALAAHPDSGKRALRWRAWDAPVDGFEWLNTDTEWRDESRARLAWTALHALFRGPESIADLFDAPAGTLARWDAEASRGRRLVAVGALDAHARLGWRGSPDDSDADTLQDRIAVRAPSYRVMFQTASISVSPSASLSGDPAADATAVTDAIRSGRVVTLIDALGRGGALELNGEGARGPVHMGDVAGAADLPLALTARTRAPDGSLLVLKRNGRAVATSAGAALVHDVTSADLDAAGDVAGAAYRVEVQTRGAPGQPPVPWAVSNPIFVWRTQQGVRNPAGRGGGAGTLSPPHGGAVGPDLVTAAPWHVEHDAGSTAELTPAAGTDAGLTFRYALATGTRTAWAAAVADLASVLPDEAAIGFEASAGRPMRLSVQLRAADGKASDRWERSVYIDQDLRRIDLAVADLQPAGNDVPRLRRTAARSLLFVVDRTNSPAGATGVVQIRRVSAGSRSR